MGVKVGEFASLRVSELVIGELASLQVRKLASLRVSFLYILGLPAS